MPEFHFIEDYEKHVSDLIATMSLDKAMEAAVGGNYEAIGDIELAQLRYAGFQKGSSIVDLGCGSGRLASALQKAGENVNYVGLDVIQSLLDYAKTKSPPNYKFILNRELSLPLSDSSFDLGCAFSVFTHLLHHEVFIYLLEFARVLKPGAKLLFSFVEFASPLHWETFQITANNHKLKKSTPLNTFIERNVIEVWAQRAGFHVQGFIDGHNPLSGLPPLGQSSVILQKRLS